MVVLYNRYPFLDLLLGCCYVVYDGLAKGIASRVNTMLAGTPAQLSREPSDVPRYIE